LCSQIAQASRPVPIGPVHDQADVVYDEERSNWKPTTMPPSDKTKETAPKKTPVKESKVVETAAKAESLPKVEGKPDGAAKKQGMGEGQKPVTKAYKDNWNAIFAKKKKR
jgi:hypothetical protein